MGEGAEGGTQGHGGGGRGTWGRGDTGTWRRGKGGTQGHGGGGTQGHGGGGRGGHRDVGKRDMGVVAHFITAIVMAMVFFCRSRGRFWMEVWDLLLGYVGCTRIS